MSELDGDWGLLVSTVQDLEDYLLSEVLYWPIRGSKGLSVTQLTIGNFLLSLRRIQAAENEEGQNEEMRGIQTKLEEIRNRWRSNWEKKAIQEFENRINLWSNYLGTISELPGQSKGDYPYNVRLRVILHLLSMEIQKPLPREESHMLVLDQRLKAKTHPAKFVWDPDLEKGFSQDEYWFLYRSP